MFVIDLLLLALRAVIFPDPGMERVFIHAKIARCLSNRLLRLDREFDCAFLKFSGILCRRGLTHRTHLICCVVSVSPCVRKSIATSLRGAEFLAGELIEQRRLIVFQGALQEPIGECVDVVLADLAIAEMRLDSEKMLLPGLRPRAVGGEDGGSTASWCATKATASGGALLRSSGTKPMKRRVHSWRA